MNGQEREEDENDSGSGDLDQGDLEKGVLERGADYEGLVLQSARLLLQRPHRRDMQAIAREVGRVEIARNLATVPHPYDHIDATSWYANVKAGWAINSFTFGLYRQQRSRELIGVVSIEGLLARADPCPALGYWLAVDHWGQGLMSEALGEIIRFAFEPLNIPLLEATYLKTNRASGRVMEKNGLERVKETLLWSRYYGTCLPGVLMRIRRAEWQAKGQDQGQEQNRQ